MRVPSAYTLFHFTTANSSSVKDDVHAPPINMSDEKETEKVYM